MTSNIRNVFDLTGKVAMVTGGGRGIGRAISLTLAQNGADVVVADINPEDAEAVAGEVAGMDRRSMAERVDVTSQESVESMVQKVIARFGRIVVIGKLFKLPVQVRRKLGATHGGEPAYLGCAEDR